MKTYLVLLSIMITLTVSQTPSQQPIIGVYTQDADDFLSISESTSTYIAASYIKNM